MKWTNEQVEYAKRKREMGHSMAEIAHEMSIDFGEQITRIAVESKLKRERNKNKNISFQVAESKEVKSETDLDSLSTLEKISDLNNATNDEIVKAHGFDPEKFELLSVNSGVWQQGAKDGVRDLVKSSIKVKPRTVISEKSLEQLIKDNVEPYIVESARIEQTIDRNLVIPLADIHFGITSFDDIYDKLNELLRIIISNQYDEIVVENIGDYFHSDKINTTETVRGTILDDVNMVQAIEDGMRFMSSILKVALNHANKVSVKSIGGNHSFDNEYLFMKWVEERFPQVDVEVTNKYRTAYMLGNVLIMVQHGDVAKKEVELLLATEYPMLWGQKSVAEVHRGHLHTEKITDNHGVIVRQFGTPKKEDKYEIKNGWTGNTKELVALEYSENKLKTEYHI